MLSKQQKKPQNSEFTLHELVPKQAIFDKKTGYQNVKISPNGKYLSYVFKDDLRWSLCIAELTNLSEKIVVAETENGNDSWFLDCLWTPSSNSILYTKIIDDNYEKYGIYKYDIKEKINILITPENKNLALYPLGFWQTGFFSHNYPDEVLVHNLVNLPNITLNRIRTNGGILDINAIAQKSKKDFYRLNFETKKLEKHIVKNINIETDRPVTVFFDSEWQPNFAASFAFGSDTSWYYWNKKEKEWELLFVDDSLKMRMARVVCKTNNQEDDVFYTIETPKDSKVNALITYNVDSKEKKTVLKNNEDLVDINFTDTFFSGDYDKSFLLSPDGKSVQVVYFNYDKFVYQILDESIREDFRILAEYRGLKNEKNDAFYVVDRTVDDRHWVIAYENNDLPTVYCRYDRDNKKVVRLFGDQSHLEKYSWAKTNPVIIKSRDGLDLVSYLTLPNGIELDGSGKANRKSPLIVYIHGGPCSRDYNSFGLTRQLFVDRGYAVLSVNFRGSTGFGKEFLAAGQGEWGNKMIDDIIDGTQWAIDHGIADPKKMAVVGTSYGGYAVQNILSIKAPDLFTCGISVCGITDVIKLYKKTTMLMGKKTMEELNLYYLPKETKERESISPINSVPNIKKPLLLVHGGVDRWVNPEQSQLMFEEMKKAGLPITYVLYKNEGHGIEKITNLPSYLTLFEQFLGRHLGGKAEGMLDSNFETTELVINGQEGVTKELVNEFLQEQEQLGEKNKFLSRNKE